MDEIPVLVVEDEPLILLDLETALEEAGFRVIGVTTAEAAIKAFDEAPVSSLITDIRLGPGKNGWQLARDLRGVNPAIPVIYISGDGAPYWSAEGVPESIMISKPFAIPQIITALSILLNRQHPTRPGDEVA
ncbi:response regulator [Mesorhizobium sp. M7A.F.Ca.CA.001.09.2.1]|uniref:Response regulator n=1 Tax=Mesorhizobium ciceri TaxID=39645 RepID=A0AB38TKJ7_9HYPH|nr:MULTISPECIES: response regulator [Mesorhizobium]RUY51005.1 response regulator [Mesorhizobium sp. M7A.F.Ca.CA.001.13.2.1]MDF3217374.1 response regulator [Mesorhizobium ciceri]RUY59424.1 response regulator [Mesorhizobium sp. M7A.F.Ca.CA.001.05.1.1]RUY60482.1 response regulator [Mesorhizobium sp. M7A.F.Ca.CA.001.13.1.1]RUY76434.1 response regulator [Mesorhizobium sp. M7A.F.Ca.CA.001.09.2.1]